ncbi:hypothetical protein KIL84_016412 [Mauremys mutica]|uniref:Uncharacterized protein n=1 Tax=Mauremys mutica TaxID=74926 RepID=A0A9D4AVT9_9SAUR|nr:hypothetical protein KIL84_016412 [Mauremys mutica]
MGKREEDLLVPSQELGRIRTYHSFDHYASMPANTPGIQKGMVSQCLARSLTVTLSTNAAVDSRHKGIGDAAPFGNSHKEHCRMHCLPTDLLAVLLCVSSMIQRFSNYLAMYSPVLMEWLLCAGSVWET